MSVRDIYQCAAKFLPDHTHFGSHPLILGCYNNYRWIIDDYIILRWRFVSTTQLAHMNAYYIVAAGRDSDEMGVDFGLQLSNNRRDN